MTGWLKSARSWLAGGGTGLSAKKLFRFQGRQQSLETITDYEKALGAPWPPIPESFARIPEKLELVQQPASDAELTAAANLRAPFIMNDYHASYMNDIVRAMRLAATADVYVEVGTFDRGNLAYMSAILPDNASLIGIDTVALDEHDERLRALLKPGQSYHSIIGDSRTPAVLDELAKALNGRKTDVVFIDGGHDAFSVMSDYANLSPLVRDGGLIMFHDAMWNGTPELKGTADALAEIDKLDPVWLVATDRPCHRFIRPLWRDAVWGTVGIIVK